MKCKWCKGTAFIKQGRIWLCKKHYRFQQMRVRAKRKGKEVPSYNLLDEMLYLVGSVYMACPACGSKMNWLSSEGKRTVISLQHNRDGTLGFLCRSCNTRHAYFPGDTFYDVPFGHKFCNDCQQVLPFKVFSRDKFRSDGYRSYCKPCAYLRQKKYISQNRSKYNEKRRRYYHARITAGNPIPR